MDEILEARKKRLKKIQKKQEYHGWLIVDDKYVNVFDTFYYKNTETDKLVKVSKITNTNENPFIPDIMVDYQGIIHECHGKCLKEYEPYKGLSSVNSDIFF